MEILLKQAIRAARAAGSVVMNHYATGAFTRKADGTPLTAADTEAHDLIVRHLTETEIPILSEESTEKILAPYPEYLWVIDPLDGTKDFLSKTPDFSVMIALLENGRPSIGVVFAPAHGALYYALRGNGAFMEKDGAKQELHVSNRTEELRGLRSVRHATDDMERVARALDATLVPRGSVGVRAGLIAEGESDFFFSKGRFGEWDVCAPQLIATEAGGTVSDVRGEQIPYGNPGHRLQNGVVFSNGACHARVLDAIRNE